VVNLEGITRIVFIGSERRDHDRAVDADTRHSGDHLFTRGRVETVRRTRPRPAGMISIEGMNLYVDDWHGLLPDCSMRHSDEFVHQVYHPTSNDAQTPDIDQVFLRWPDDPRRRRRRCGKDSTA